MVQKILLAVLVGGTILAASWAIRAKLNTNFNPPSLPNAITFFSPAPSPTSTAKPSIIPKPPTKIQITAEKSGLIRVEISQDQLNTQIKTALVGQSLGSTPLGEAKITDASVVINNGFMLISGTAQNGPVNLPFQTKATLSLENSQPKLGLSDLSLNNIPLPQLIADQLSSTLQSKVNDLINSYHFQLKSIDLEPDKINLTGQK